MFFEKPSRYERFGALLIFSYVDKGLKMCMFVPVMNECGRPIPWDVS